MAFLRCPFCRSWRAPFRSLCKKCQSLFEILEHNRGKVGLNALMDKLLETGIDKEKIKNFLDADPLGKGSLMDQIIAELTNDLARGMGVKKGDMTPEDVKMIREKPCYGASSKPLDH